MIPLSQLALMNTISPVSDVRAIRGFSQYKTTVMSLPTSERLLADEVAEFIFKSFWPGRYPVVRVELVGHADVDQKGPVFERNISEDRAKEVMQYLKNKVFDLARDFKSAPSAADPSKIKWDPRGVGAKEPAAENKGKNPNTLTEHQRALNRRVEIKIKSEVPSQPVEPWTFDPIDAKARLQKAVEDSLRRRVVPLPTPVPIPIVPDWFWKDLKPFNDEEGWKKWRDAVKEWCEQNHIDPKPILDTFKDIVIPDDGKTGPIDEDVEDELRKRRAITGEKPSDDD
jgi:hypothetical protein